MPQLRMAHKLWSAVIAIVVAQAAVVGFSGYRTSQAQAQAEMPLPTTDKGELDLEFLHRDGTLSLGHL